MKLNKLSIKWKIFIYLIGFCSALLILLWLFQVVFLERFYKIVKINSIKSNANTIIKNLDNDDIDLLIKSISQNDDMCIEIFSEYGTLINESNNMQTSVIYKLTQYEKDNLKLNLQNEGGEFLYYFNKEDLKAIKHYDKMNGKMGKNIDESIIYGKLAENKNGETRIVIINAMISPVNATIQTLRIQLYYITGFMIIFSVLLAFIISKKVSEPIVAINKSAKVLAKADYSVQFKGDGYEEISELASTLNYAAKELSKVDNLRKELIANVSHDLRTPLTLISGYAEIMRDLPNENNVDNVQIIIDETKRLTTLVNDMLDISKLQAGIINLSISSFNLTKTIQEVIMRFSELTKKDGYDIEFSYDQDTFVTADEIKITQVIYNLLTNAINYTGSDKKVIIKQIISNGFVKVEIIDTGEGIAEEELSYIWERYYKSNKSHKRAVMGTGLGLSIVKSILESHKGVTYGVKSKLNKGSIFWFKLKSDERK
ncbi:hypothetical protein UT300005_21480 [Clostridium sp. CTA-5]